MGPVQVVVRKRWWRVRRTDVVVVVVVMLVMAVVLLTLLHELEEGGRHQLVATQDAFIAKSLRQIMSGGGGGAAGGGGRKCYPRHNVMYLKTHKCASSMLQNIFFRYAMTHNKTTYNNNNRSQQQQQQLTSNTSKEITAKGGRARESDPIVVAVPPDGTYFGSPRKFSADMLKRPSWLLPVEGERVNVFAVHTRLDYEEMRKVVEPGALWVTAVKHPVLLYTSLFYYFKVWGAEGEGLRSLLARPLERHRWTTRLKGIFGVNQMTFDLGYGKDTFYDDRKIDLMIREVERHFDLVLVTERMDESLVLLRHALCWTIHDVLAFKKNARIERAEGVGAAEGRGSLREREKDRGRGRGGRREGEVNNVETDTQVRLLGDAGRGDTEPGAAGVEVETGADDAQEGVQRKVEKEPLVLTEEEETKIAQLNYADLRLYQHFADKFDQVVMAYGRERLQREVDELRRERRRLEEYCIEEEVPGHDPRASVKEYSGSVVGYRLARPEDPTCRALAWNTRHFVDFFKNRQRALFRARVKKEILN